MFLCILVDYLYWFCDFLLDDGRYQLPIALFGLISCLALWDVFKLSVDWWGLDRYPLSRQILIRIAQCGELLII